MDERFEDGFLRDEAGQRRNACHRGGPDGRHDGQGPGGTEDAGQFADVARSGLVVDDAHHQEQGGLEQPVGQEEGESGEGCLRRAEAHHHGQEPELTYGAVGQDELDVSLPESPIAAHQHRGQAQPKDHGKPVVRGAEAGREPGNEVDPRFHHGRGVQVGTHRRGGRHGAGEPEVERDQRGFGDCPDQDQQDGGAHRGSVRSRGQRRRLLQDGLDPVSAGRAAENDQAHEHGQAPGGGHDQRLQCGAAGGQPGPGIADEQVGQHRGQFPEDEHQEQIVRGHESEHRPGEGEQLRAEAAQVVIACLEIARAVHQDQRPHAQDEQRHDPGQRIHPERQFEVKSGNPRHHLRDGAGCGIIAACTTGGNRPRFHAALGIDVPVLQNQPDEGAGGNRGQGVESIAAEPGEQRRRHSGQHEVQGKDCDHYYLRNVRISIVKSRGRRGFRWVRCPYFTKRAQILLAGTPALCVRRLLFTL